MNSSHCSRIALAALLVLAALAVPAAATTVTESEPVDSAEVGSDVDVSYELTDLYANGSGDWTLSVSTAAESPTWTVALYDNQGNLIGSNRTVTTASFTQSIGGSTDRVVVRLRGTVPEPANGNYTYEPAQSVVLADFDRVQGNAESGIDTITTRPYTDASSEARLAIENATDAVDSARSAGAGVASANDTLTSAVDAYDGENFDNAVTLAQQAEQQAENARESSEQTSMLLYAGGGLAVVAVLAGAGVWYLRGRESHDELG